MRIGKYLALLLSLLCTGAATADTRVELIGRVDFNGLALGHCFNTPCPWQNVRPGEYVYVTFIVNDAGHDFSANWPDCPNQDPRTIGDVLYDIRNGTMFARAGGVSLGIPVSQGPVYTSPVLRMVNDNCAVDAIEIESAIMGRGGRCCYANGSCTYTAPATCEGTWTIDGVCTPTENSCPQPNGACCGFDNTCSVTSKEECVGTWVVGACLPDMCPVTPGSCCLTNGSCAMTTETACTGTWTAFGVCDTTSCPWPALAPDYAMDLTLRAPKTLFTNSTITDNYAVFPFSALDPNHSWTVIFQSDEMFIYDATTFRFSSTSTPTGSCCPGDGHCLVTTQAICPQQASWVSGGACGPTTCPAGSGACCKADGTCELLNSAACAALPNAIYKGDSTACNTSQCPPTGACCNAGGCSIIIQSACVATGGAWLGEGTSCAATAEFAVVLGNAAGRCCKPNGECELLYETSCTGFGYTFTAGQTCEVPCVGAGACCNPDPNGACVVILQANCENLNGIWTGAATCENACFDVGACCNAVAGSCTIVPQTACPGGNTWTADTTCAAACSAGTGKCCNTFSGQCRVTTQPFCSGAWTAGQTCAAPCTGVSATLPDAVFNVSTQTTTPATWTNSISISDPQTVQSVEVWFNVDFMSRLNDIRVSITGPNGATLPLFTRIGAKPPLCTATPIGAGQTMTGAYVFADSAPVSFFDYCAAIGVGTNAAAGRYRAAGCGGTASVLNAPSPAGFGGISASGTWTLTVVDERSGISLILDSWGLSFNGGNPAPCTIGQCVNGPSCAASTFAQCTTGTWTTGACAPTSPSGACCFLDTCVVMAQALCPPGGMFVGNGTTCGPANICKVACCMSDGTCVFTAPFTCAGIAGAAGSTCSPTNTCPQRGACCVTATGACTYGLQAACTASGSVWNAGSTCTPNTCPNQPTAPANDVCASVLTSGPDVVLSSGAWTSSGATLTGATPDGVNPSCGSGTPAADVWFRFSPPATGPYTVATCTTTPTWDTVVSLWSSCTSEVPGACADDTCGSSPAVYGHGTTTPTLTGGATYLVRVGAFSPATTGVGNFTLSVTALGACCLSNGTCQLRAQSACTGANFQFHGLHTTCTPTNPCVAPRACCNPSTFQCLLVSPFACNNGRIVGYEGSTCSPNQCPIPFCCRGTTCAMINPIDCLPIAGSQALMLSECNGNTSWGCCYADFNHDGAPSIDDLFLYLNAYFNGSPFANFGGDGVATPTIDDLFLYINAYFVGCM